MRKLLILVLALTFVGSENAYAHQPVALLNTDTTAIKGPLLVDGTISFAVRAAFAKAGEQKAFRAGFVKGDEIKVQYLILDKKPLNALRPAQLPSLVITSPTGSSMTLKLNERTKFYEPYSGVNYLYLGRYEGVAESGEYSFVITSKRRAEVTIGVGEKEGIRGEVIRGAKPTPASSATPTPTPVSSATPTKVGYTMAQVNENDSAKNCWSVINGDVYDLTKWIGSHPGGTSAIISLCGKDGTSSFSSKHGIQGGPAGQLSKYRLGPLEK